ncbi:MULTISPECIES: SGM_3592 family protein [unclassified Streptomyces]|uniref:SGM_3592 family protein n=1 Tax=unclassified Streptomyces TaxID=2593676 RepID=UPI003FA38A4E
MNSGGGRAGEPDGEKGSREPRNGREPEDVAAPGEGLREPGTGEPESAADPDSSATNDADSVEFDEAFIRAADVTEPAARTRQLAARWRKEGYPEREPWRSDEPPAGWFWSRARQGGHSRRRRRRHWPWRRKPGD